MLYFLSNMPADLFTDDLSALGNDDLFAAIQEFANIQQTEGWRHDYTEQWDESSLKNVAAFANTFGGLLIVGVKKGKRDVAPALVGVQSESEYKTRIASAIAANISPVPSYNIFECLMPGDGSKRFCIVRVREGRALHLITKKGFDPVYVRNEDESRKADAAQLRGLIERERVAPILAERIRERANQLRDAMWIGSKYERLDTEGWNYGPHQQSGTFLKLEIIAAEASPVVMEKSHEDWLKNAIATFYPRFRETVSRGVANQAETRGAEFYEYTVYHKELDYESKWRITSKGDLGHTTQMNYRFVGSNNVWSAVDLANYTVLFIRLAMNWWEFLPYFGGGRLFAQLSIPGLTILRHPQHGYYTHAFDPTYSPARSIQPPSLQKDAIVLTASPGNAANAEADVTYSSGCADTAGTTTLIVTQLLRSLGHGAARSFLQSDVKALLTD